MENKYSFEDFREIIDTLLGENGCPWDRAQTHESLRQYLIEECYETVDAIDNRDMSALKEELGDVLLQVMLHSKMSEKESGFTLDDVIDGVSRKMINRHRHVSFDLEPARVEALTADDVLKSWDSIKDEEKGAPLASESMRGVPKSLPALMRAVKVYKYAEKTHPAEPARIVLNMLAELLNLLEILNSDRPNDSAELPLGRLAFNIAIFSRFLQINPEFALTNVVEKFITTFEHTEGRIGGDSALQEIYASLF